MSAEADLWLSRRLNALQRDPDGAFLPATLAPTDRHIATIKARVGALEASLTPSQKPDIARIVSSLLRAFPTRNADTGASMDVLSVYVSALQEFPVWVVSKIAQEWVKGRCEGQSTQYAPTPAQWATHCKKIVDGLLEEKGRLEIIACAKPLPAPAADSGASRSVIENLAKSWRTPEPQEVKPLGIKCEREPPHKDLKISPALKGKLETMGATFS